jgi:multiple antibiotic resistance protein
VRELLLFYVSLFSILNPLSVIPTFIGLTQGATRIELRRITRQASFAVFLILMASYTAGEAVLGFFSISVASLRIAGGVLIFGMAWSMLQATISRAKQTKEEAAEATERQSIAVVPLAMPLLAGPGSISLMIIVSGRMDGLANHGIVALGTAVMAITTWLVLLAAGPISRALGRTGLNVATRFMGLILAAIAVEFIASGLLEIFPGWSLGPRS